MTIPVSTVPVVTAYLFNAITTQVKTDPDPGSIYVCVGEPGIEDPQSIIEVCSEIIRVPEHFAFVGDGGSKAMEEKYQLIIKVSSALRGSDQSQIAQAVVNRAWQILAYVETAIRLDPSFGQVVVEGWPGETNGGEATWANNGMVCELEMRVEVEAVI